MANFNKVKFTFCNTLYFDWNENIHRIGPIGTVVAEFVAGTGSSTGLSWIIIESGNRLDIAKLFAALILLVLLGVFLFLMMSAIEYSVLRRWHQSTK